MDNSEKQLNEPRMNQDLFNSDDPVQSGQSAELVHTSFGDSELVQTFQEETTEFDATTTLSESVSSVTEETEYQDDKEDTDSPVLEYQIPESIYDEDILCTENAITVLERRYLKKDETGNPVETPKEMFRRVARTMAEADLKHDKNADVDAVERAFYAMMSRLEFVPNSPTLMNAGRELGQLFSLFCTTRRRLHGIDIRVCKTHSTDS